MTPPARRHQHADHLGVTRQKQTGLMAVGLCVPTGRLRPDQMDELAALADRYGTGEIRLTTGQNAILANVPEERVEPLLREPLLRELSPTPSPFFRGMVACTGTDFCNLAQIQTKKLALELSTALEERFGADGSPFTINWSGCPAGCGNHQAADIGFRGMKVNVGDKLIEAVAIYTGGRTGPGATAGEQIVDMVPCDGSLADIVRLRAYVADASYSEPVLKVQGEVFGDVRPAATIVVVAGLLTPDMKVEIEAQARLRRG